MTCLFTIGHSSRSLDDFLGLLSAHAVRCVVDVRRLPGSRAFPHFDADPLAAALAAADMTYWHLSGLCGRRSAVEVHDFPVGHFWRHAGFARYAAWTHSDEFAAALDALMQRARSQRCVLMCAEAVWWRCHRRIITDCLLARDCTVCHIMGPGKTVAATLTPGAEVRAGRVIYPAAGI